MVREGYKHTEVGEIPVDWRSLPLSEATISVSSGTSATKSTGFDYPIYGSTGLIGSSRSYDYSGKKILVARVGANAGKVNEVSGEYCVSDNTLIVDLGKKYSIEYFYYQLVYKNLNQLVFGSGQPLITGGQLKALYFPVPSAVSEQEKIAKVLSDIDELILSLEKLIAKKRDIKTATMQQLLTGKKRLPGFGEGKGYKQTELGEIPEDWDLQSIFQIVDYQKSLFDDGDWIEAEHITNWGVRLIQTGNIGVGSYLEKDAKKYIYPKSFKSLRCKELRQGDILICRLAEPAGRACVFPGTGDEIVITSVDVTIYRPDGNTTSREFLNQYLASDQWFHHVNEHVGGTTHKRISRSALGNILVPIPCHDEQLKIGKILSDMDEAIRSIETRLEKTKSIKQGMVQELLTGRTRLVDVNATPQSEEERMHGT